MKKHIIIIPLFLMLGQVYAVSTYAQADDIQNLLDALNEENPEVSEATAEDPDSDADAIQELLDNLADDNSESDDGTAADTENMQSGEMEEGASAENTGTNPAGAVSQADYTLMDGYDLTSLNETVAVQVPSAWGNNVGASEKMVSYSPANQSGATDPHSSTLSTIWYDTDMPENAILEEYVDNIRKQDFFSDVEAQPFTVAGQEGLSISYTMDVGTNSFQCRSACFVYGNILYSVEMCQGVKSTQDYFPVFQDVVGSEAIMDGDWDMETPVPEPEPVPAPEPEPVPAPEPEPVPAPEPEPVPAPEPEPVPAPEPEPVPQFVSPGGDLGDFTYTINGHTYEFPTAISDLAHGDLKVDMTLELSAEDDSSAAGSELVNTLYFVLNNFPARELIGVTNLTGANAPMSSGILTALVDTTADTVNVELPGGLKIGSPEASIPQAFPEFKDLPMDGVAEFRGKELLYACNVRDDGCDGYVIIRSDAPYCSALSIICEKGVIREINFQCLGTSVLDFFNS